MELGGTEFRGQGHLTAVVTSGCRMTLWEGEEQIPQPHWLLATPLLWGSPLAKSS